MNINDDEVSEKIEKVFGARVKAAREAVALSQSDIARSMKVAPQAVQKWEDGTSLPRLAKIYRLAKVLGVPVSYLLPDVETDLPLVDPKAMRTRLLAERLSELSEEKVKAIAIILELSL